jgi:phosphoribosylanthranilate isomerase
MKLNNTSYTTEKFDSGHFSALGTQHSRILVKICGVTTLADARMVAAAGADWIGLNFHPGSPRRVEPSVAAEIVAALPDSTMAVGVFVDRPPDEVAAIAERVGLGIVQLHGDEPPDSIAALGHLQVVRAFRLGDVEAVERMRTYLRRTETLGRPPDAILIDAYVPQQPGGTGHTVDLDLLKRLPPLPPLILAGGLTPENVAERISRVRPWMVDVASGVESIPGRKDPARVAAFLRAAREEKTAANSG